MAARRGAVDHAAHDALQYAGDAKHVVREIKIPVGDAGAAGALAVSGNVFLLAGNSQRLEVDAADAAKLRLRNVPAHAVVGKVRQRMAERGQFPVEDGE